MIGRCGHYVNEEKGSKDIDLNENDWFELWEFIYVFQDIRNLNLGKSARKFHAAETVYDFNRKPYKIEIVQVAHTL